VCQSYKIACRCNQHSAEIFFGKCVLNETAIEALYCPQCSRNIEGESDSRVWDNDWILELNMDVVRQAGSDIKADAGSPRLWLRFQRAAPSGVKGFVEFDL
jgi:hypothetical protein